MAAVDRFHLLYREISRSCNFYIEALAIVGAWYTVRKCVSLAFNTYGMLRLHVIPRLGSKVDLVKQYGKWAVVTGKEPEGVDLFVFVSTFCASTVELASSCSWMSFVSQATACLISACKLI